VADLINELNSRLARELRESPDSPYLRPAEIVSALADADDPPSPVLERAFEDYFVDAPESFDATLFHYLLVRLGKVESRVAVAYCLETLRGKPEETEAILHYLADVDLEVEELDAMAEYLGSEDAIYDYQLFQVLRWFLARDSVNDRALHLCRVWGSDRNRDPWLQSYAIAYVGRFGDVDDLQEVEQMYSESANDVERADRIGAVRRMERSRRNAFYARVAGDSELVRRAVKVAKATRR